MPGMGLGPRLGVLAMICAAGCGSSSSSPASDGLVGFVSRGSVNIQFANTAGSNLSPTHVPANEVTVDYRDPSRAHFGLNVGGFVDEGNDVYGRRWHLAITFEGDPAPGANYPASPQPDTPGLGYVYLQDDDAAASWTAGGGTITVLSVVDTKVSFAVDVTMVPNGDTAVGTFSMSGVLSINNVNDVCDCLF